MVAGVEVFRTFPASAAVQNAILGILPPTPNRPINLVEGLGMGVGAGVGAAFVVLATLSCLVRLTVAAPLPAEKEVEEVVAQPPAPAVGSAGARPFTLEDLQTATHNFSPACLVGVAVHHGRLAGGKQVAVKQLGVGSGEGWAAVGPLARLHHRHLVELVGYCLEGPEVLLVYSLPSGGSLAEQVEGELCWGLRLRIATEAARGLHYLHMGASPPVIHG